MSNIKNYYSNNIKTLYGPIEILYVRCFSIKMHNIF